MAYPVRVDRWLSRYRKVKAFADAPTPFRRCIAALIAGAVAFSIAQLLFGVVWGAGWQFAWLSGFAFAVAAAYSAATTKHGLAFVYGLLGAIWLLAELLVLTLTALTPG